MTDKWDKRFLNLATLVASWSKDTTKVGVNLEFYLGYNPELGGSGADETN